jgi:hypothetical protein
MTSPKSTLVRVNPDGTEYRICGCGDHYTLPMPYDKANKEIRDMCPVCVSIEQWDRLNAEEEATP